MRYKIRVITNSGTITGDKAIRNMTKMLITTKASAKPMTNAAI